VASQKKSLTLVGYRDDYIASSSFDKLRKLLNIAYVSDLAYCHWWG